MLIKETYGYEKVVGWMQKNHKVPFAFQIETWGHIANHDSGLVNAPTGCGKTFSVFLGCIIDYINQNQLSFSTKKDNGLQLLWVTPLRALAKDIGRAMQEALVGLSIPWQVGIRNGDTDTSERQKQKRKMPEVLIITPESLHLLLAQKGNNEIFAGLKTIAVDEWHELLGSKRGVQVELALSRIIGYRSSILTTNSHETIKKETTPPLSIWGISATIGNLEVATDVLLRPLSMNNLRKTKPIMVEAKMEKKIDIVSIFPDEIERYPWAGHNGLHLAKKVVEIIEKSRTTLIFINTRGMSERWYQTLLDVAPDLAGAIALHHGSIEQELRLWVEEALHTEKLKAVVCTASLDLGVDFRPVDTVIQVGSPKGVSRFLQRAGRSGHAPGETSRIYFLPTHSLELVEAAALKSASAQGMVENKEPMVLCFDVLVQYLCTLAVGGGFDAENVFEEVTHTFCFEHLSPDDFHEAILHITSGGTALKEYNEFQKVGLCNGVYLIKDRRTAMRHRMHIGTIVSDAMMKVKMMGGGFVGVIEETFISKLNPGDSFILAGRNMELVMVKDMVAFVKKSTSKKTIIPSWMGGRMSLTANLGQVLRETFELGYPLRGDGAENPELSALAPLFALQETLSHIPKANELLIEQMESKEGYHLLAYPFEGRQVHEALGALIAYRIAQIKPVTFSISMNDYGFELFSDTQIDLDEPLVRGLFSITNLLIDIQKSMNSVEMAMRKFREIAVIGGLIFQGMPNEQKKARHLQSSASLLFKVLSDFDPNNFLLRQAYNEVLSQQMDEARLRRALSRIEKSRIVITKPTQFTPLSFPIIVDGLNRNSLTSEKLEDRILKMQKQLEKSAR